MTNLLGHLPPLVKVNYHDVKDYRHPPLTPQIQWMKQAARMQRYKFRDQFLDYTNFTIVSRQKSGGPAELIRLVLTYAGIQFKDEIIPEVDWKALIQKTPYGRMPVLWINHKAYGEPNAIVRHMASHMGLLGVDMDETMLVEAIVLQVETLRDSDIIQKAYEELSKNRPDDNVDIFLENLLPTNFSQWDKRIEKTIGPFILPSGISLADLAIYDFVSQHRKFFPLDEELHKHNNLLFLCTLVPRHGGLKAYSLKKSVL